MPIDIFSLLGNQSGRRANAPSSPARTGRSLGSRFFDELDAFGSSIVPPPLAATRPQANAPSLGSRLFDDLDSFGSSIVPPPLPMPAPPMANSFAQQRAGEEAPPPIDFRAVSPRGEGMGLTGGTPPVAQSDPTGGSQRWRGLQMPQWRGLQMPDWRSLYHDPSSGSLSLNRMRPNGELERTPPQGRSLQMPEWRGLQGIDPTLSPRDVRDFSTPPTQQPPLPMAAPPMGTANHMLPQSLQAATPPPIDVLGTLANPLRAGMPRTAQSLSPPGDLPDASVPQSPAATAAPMDAFQGPPDPAQAYTPLGASTQSRAGAPWVQDVQLANSPLPAPGMSDRNAFMNNHLLQAGAMNGVGGLSLGVNRGKMAADASAAWDAMQGRQNEQSRDARIASDASADRELRRTQEDRLRTHGERESGIQRATLIAQLVAAGNHDQAEASAIVDQSMPRLPMVAPPGAGTGRPGQQPPLPGGNGQAAVQPTGGRNPVWHGIRTQLEAAATRAAPGGGAAQIGNVLSALNSANAPGFVEQNLPAIQAFLEDRFGSQVFDTAANGSGWELANPWMNPLRVSPWSRPDENQEGVSMLRNLMRSRRSGSHRGAIPGESGFWPDR